ncbi:secondary thiamine-phosphate synthase enzyme YjbQ [Legionella jordanis]|uniref:secondary thiamine-phosphate synthase enzyme YjbQ n=1 Tax=Legionella jordanis TaxID=456 RepID=UPI0007308BEC|nr:secondary thiamine-phosphate synthase enzyme YjbQ [Legionella jordanis]RMX05317.1 YjbQ family protein [Legionella jordanis]RMX20832.1 YjbQ family protein [Legionella jordanis]HAT8713594.1 YjbQ family protein [Legionella jordanis]
MDKQKTLYWQTECNLVRKARGFHLITDEVKTCLIKMPKLQIGLVHIFLQHTSASLALNENASPEVRRDLERFFNQLIPEDGRRYEHSIEGEDDMPAHIKNVIIGSSLTIPLQDGKLALGQWQGIYLCEHRNEADARRLIITVHGQAAN